MERVVERHNAKRALKRVRQNKGSPGIDGMTVEELPAYLAAHEGVLRSQLLAGTYEPKPVRRVEIPKDGGGTRALAIPTVVDRYVQQLILQVLQPLFDPTFSDGSYGFRPGRNQHDAICAAQRLIQAGRRWVVDVDLEKFFDRVNHDVLMGLLAKRIGDKRLLRVIRRFLEAGVMANGVVRDREEGTPQGGPLSPLLANVMLHVVDRELEARGHAFVRYADDCNVYVRSKAAGERVMRGLSRLLERLHLRINHDKSAVDRPWKRRFLGFSFWSAKDGIKRRVSPKALAKMKDRVRQITRRSVGRSVPMVIEDLTTYLRGWNDYFKLADTPNVFDGLDGWIRRRLRALQLKHWRTGRTIYRETIRLGLSAQHAKRIAANGRSWWQNSAISIHIILNARYYDRLGLPRLGR